MPEPSPASPCVNICVLDQHGYCQGCYRTIQEIANWSRLSPGEQYTLLGNLRQRRAGRRSNNCSV